MSSGQKSWADEQAEDAQNAHLARLEEIGYEGIADIADHLRLTVRCFEGDIISLPRGGWFMLDKMKKLVERLS